MSIYRIMIVDDHSLASHALCMALEELPETQVVGWAGNGAQAIILYNNLRPDLVLIDICQPVVDGAQAIEAICQQDSKARVLALTSASEEEKIIAAIQAGACGYVTKESGRQQLVDAVRRLRQGESYLSPLVPTGKVKNHSAAALHYNQRLR